MNNLIFQVKPADFNPATGVLTPDVGPTGTLTSSGGVSVQPNATANGLSSLNFDGTGGFALSSPIAQTTNAVTIFAVVLPNYSSGSGPATILSGPPGSLQYRIDDGGNLGDQAFLDRFQFQFGNSSLPVGTTSFSLIDASNDPGGAANSVVFNNNGVRVGDNNATGVNVGNLTAFGAGDNGDGTYNEFFSGQIAEVQVYDGVLPAAQRQSVEASLETAFGIGVVNPNFAWVAATGPFTAGTNWNQGVAPNNASSAVATISNGGTAQITAGNTIGLLDFYVGSNASTGVGSVAHTGGDLTVTQALVVGNAGGTGSYNLSGGTITAGAIVVGSGGSGTFVQTGGSVTLSTDFEVGQNGGAGTYIMTGGSLSYSGPQFLVVYSSAAKPSVLDLSGTAVLTDSGQVPEIGYNSTGTGAVNVSGGASFTGSNGIDLGGPNGVGILNLSGNGAVGSGGDFLIGVNGGSGTINISGGTLTENKGYLQFGYGGTATLNMTGGNVSVTTGGNDVLLATFASGTTFNLSGGTFSDAGNTVAGYRGSATINVGGTAQYATNTLYLGIGSLGGSATLNLNGGTVTANTVLSQGGGVVNFNGGTLRANGNTSALLAGSSGLTVNALAGGAVLDTNGFTATVTSAIGGPGPVTKVGAGTLVLAGSNTYGGATRINAGTLQLQTPSLNLSFETPGVNGGFQYAPDGAVWTFSGGGSATGSGITGGGGFSFNGPPPDGTQAAFVQQHGYFFQAFNFPAAGTYTLSFYAEQRPNQTQQLDVTLDGNTDLSGGGFTPATSWTQTTYTFTETAGTHTLQFTGLDPLGDDETAYVDAVSFSPSVTSAQGLNSTAIPSTSAVVIAAGATLDVNGEVVTVGSLAGPSGAAVTLGAGLLTVGGDGTSTAFAGAISGGGSLTKTGVGVQTLSGANAYGGGTNVGGGTLVFASPGAFPAFTALTIRQGATATAAAHNASSGANTLFTSSLAIDGSTNTWTGTLNLANNDLVVRTGSLATVTNQVRQGYARGTWQGSGGILSSAAAADAKHLTALGVIGATAAGTFDGTAVVPGDVLVKYTYYGDATLDGKVDGLDYVRIDAGYAARNTATPLTGWFNGDFNYDGVVDGSDYTLIDNAFNLQGARFASSVVATSTAELGSAGAAAVPEPATVGLVAAGAVGLLARRRRRAH